MKRRFTPISKVQPLSKSKLQSKFNRQTERKTERDWQRIAKKLANIACASIVENSNDAEGEKMLCIIHPEGHRLAGYCRYLARGPVALITGGGQ
jgi:hypothetical protein